jgi:hypothetical protein
MSSTILPDSQQVCQSAASGAPPSKADVSNLASRENALTGDATSGPQKGGPAATAQSLYTKQQNFEQKADEINRKNPAEITSEDAREVQSAEVCQKQHIF